MATIPEINERIKQVIEQKSLTSSSFADAIDVSRPIISHILSGRNKPGLDLLQKVIQVFPDVDPRWLLTGKKIPDVNHPPIEVRKPREDLSRSDDQGRDNSSRSDAASVSSVSSGELDPEKIILLFPDGSFRLFHS